MVGLESPWPELARFTIIQVQVQKQDPVFGPRNRDLKTSAKLWNRMKLRKFKASFDSAKTGTTLVTIFRDLKIYDFDMFLLIVVFVIFFVVSVLFGARMTLPHGWNVPDRPTSRCFCLTRF